MCLIADENFPGPAVEALRADGHDLLWIRTHAPGSKDTVILEFAEAESQVILTLDKDFLQIARQRREPLWRSGVIPIQVHPATSATIMPVVRRALTAIPDWAGYIGIASVEGIETMSSRGGRVS